VVSSHDSSKGLQKPSSAALMNLKNTNKNGHGSNWKKSFERKRTTMAVIHLKANTE
jgi:hypothetical protein